MRRVRPVIVALALLAASCGTSSRTIPTVFPANGQRSVIIAGDGQTVITQLQGDENRETISLDHIPVVLQNAVVSIEDERFWDHGGVDPKGIARAAKTNSSSGGVSQGGSTITQQYIKTVLLSPERTIQRKIEEASLAIQLERTYSKKFILEQYLNTIYFGNRAYGVQVASKTYFGHAIDDPEHPLAVPEAAMLAAVINSPALYNPYKHPEAATRRRNLVIKKMAELGYITPAQETQSIAAPLQVSPPASQAPTQRYPAPHFVEEVKRFIRTDPHFGATQAEREDLLLNGGLRIYTTVDLALQAKAEAAVTQIYPNQARAIGDSKKSPDVGLVSIDPHTGYVKAMVGGYDYFDTNNTIHSYAQVNLATSGRQVGSTFKTIALAAALSNGVKITDTFNAPGATTIRLAGYAPWTVSGDPLGRASLSQCIIHSANTCFANLVADKRVLPQRVTEFAQKMGIDTKHNFDTVPSEVLGTNNSNVLEMTGAYGTFANNGVFVNPVLVTKVVRADGTVIYQNEHLQTKVVEPEVARDITTALEGVLTSGTAAGRGIDRPAAGKTGTTQGNTDAWFVGYTPQLVPGVWTGYAPPLATGQRTIGRLRQLPGVGAKMAAPVWQAFMKTALDGSPPTDFTYSIGAPGTTTTTVPPGNTDIFRIETTSPKLVSMPALTPGNMRDAAVAARRVGLRITRIDVDSPGTLPGQVLSQSPAAGSKVPSGSTIVVEATPGDPPPTVPIPDVTGQAAADATATLTKGGWKVTQTVAPAPAGLVLPSATTTTAPPDGSAPPPPAGPAPGQVWQISPAVGSVSPDGNVTITVQP